MNHKKDNSPKLARLETTRRTIEEQLRYKYSNIYTDNLLREDEEKWSAASKTSFELFGKKERHPE